MIRRFRAFGKDFLGQIINIDPNDADHGPRCALHPSLQRLGGSCGNAVVDAALTQIGGSQRLKREVADRRLQAQVASGGEGGTELKIMLAYDGGDVE